MKESSDSGDEGALTSLSSNLDDAAKQIASLVASVPDEDRNQFLEKIGKSIAQTVERDEHGGSVTTFLQSEFHVGLLPSSRMAREYEEMHPGSIADMIEMGITALNKQIY